MFASEARARQQVTKRYRCILADPAWAEKGGGKVKRGADRHYGTEGKLGDIEPHVRMLEDSGLWLPADDAHFWMWVTDTFLEDGLALMRRMGFRYIRTFKWIKTARDVSDEELQLLTDAELDALLRMGLGQYGRGVSEMMLFGVRGRGQADEVWKGDRGVKADFHAPHVLNAQGKIIHSRKPPKSYDLIERVSRGPRLEFNARIRRAANDGELWDLHGNEAPADGDESEAA